MNAKKPENKKPALKDRELSDEQLEEVDGGAWTDGCGGSFCTLTKWTSKGSACDPVKREPAPINLPARFASDI